MDADRFDALTRMLTTAGSRRQGLGLAAIGFGGGLASLLGLAEAEAGKNKKKRNKKKGNKKNNKKGCRSNADCSTCRTCINGRCTDLAPLCNPGCEWAVCGPDNHYSCYNFCQNEGKTCCGNTCIDTKNDPSNCGACGNTCCGTLRCINGSCGCPPGHEQCDCACCLTGGESCCGNSICRPTCP